MQQEVFSMLIHTKRIIVTTDYIRMIAKSHELVRFTLPPMRSRNVD